MRRMFTIKQVIELAKLVIGAELESGGDIEQAIDEVNPANAESGTIVDVLGLDSDGKVVKGAVSGGGTKIYKHSVYVTDYDVYSYNFVVYSKTATQYASLTAFINDLANMINGYLIETSGNAIILNADSQGDPIIYCVGKSGGVTATMLATPVEFSDDVVLL